MVCRQTSAFIPEANLILWRISATIFISTGIFLTDIYIQELTFYISSMNIMMQAFTNPTEKFLKMFTEKTKSMKYQSRVNCLNCTWVYKWILKYR